MFFEVAEIESRIADIRAMSGHWYRDLRDAEFYDDGEEAAYAESRIADLEGQIADLEGQIAAIESEYSDSDSLYWETAEVRGWV